MKAQQLQLEIKRLIAHSLNSKEANPGEVVAVLELEKFDLMHWLQKQAEPRVIPVSRLNPPGNG